MPSDPSLDAIVAKLVVVTPLTTHHNAEVTCHQQQSHTVSSIIWFFSTIFTHPLDVTQPASLRPGRSCNHYYGAVHFCCPPSRASRSSSLCRSSSPARPLSSALRHHPSSPSGFLQARDRRLVRRHKVAFRETLVCSLSVHKGKVCSSPSNSHSTPQVQNLCVRAAAHSAHPPPQTFLSPSPKASFFVFANTDPHKRRTHPGFRLKDAEGP